MYLDYNVFYYGILLLMQKNELAPNVMAMVQSFNRLALLVPTEILEERTPQTRSKVIATFIQVRGIKSGFSQSYVSIHLASFTGFPLCHGK